MPCTARVTTPALRLKRDRELARFREGIRNGKITAKVSPVGAVAFKGFESDLLSDICVMRMELARGNVDLRCTLARAEAAAGRKVSAEAVSSGLHSHDGGESWGRG